MEEAVAVLDTLGRNLLRKIQGTRREIERIEAHDAFIDEHALRTLHIRLRVYNEVLADVDALERGIKD